MIRQSIPTHVRLILSTDPFMEKCCIKDEDCNGRIEWHHALMFAGRAVQTYWAILPCCTYHHAIADRKDLRKKLVKILRARGGEEVKDFEKIQKLR